MTQTLFSWFNSRIAAVYGISPAAHPAETLQMIGAPLLLANMFAGLADCEVSYKEVPEGEIPDLERREKKRKRSTGQFYTPEALAGRLVGMARPIGPAGKILDPACGDGSFLMAAATRMPLSRLFGYDIDLQALFICLTRMICRFPGFGWPVLRHRDFLFEPPEEKFDLVIGNPPYRVNLDATCKDTLAELYQTGEGEKDLYTFFLEAGLRVLKPGGQMIVLTSHTWLVNHQCHKIRQHLFDRHQVEAVMLLPARFFVSAPGVLPVVTCVDNSSPGKDYSVRVLSSYSDDNGWQREFMARSAAFADGNGLRQSIVPPGLRRAFESMAAGGKRLGDVCRIGVGIQESFKREGPVSKHVSDTRLSSRHKPVLKGRELEPFKINWAGKYIDYGPHLAYAGDEKIFAGPKLLYQNIRNEKLKIRLVTAFDRGEFFPKNSLSYIIPMSDEHSFMFLLGLLNSLPVNAWFSSQFHSFHVTVTQMRQIPLPPFNADLFAYVADCAAELIKLKAGSRGFAAAFSQLNEAVCRCYGWREDLTGLIGEFDIFLEEAAGL